MRDVDARRWRPDPILVRAPAMRVDAAAGPQIETAGGVWEPASPHAVAIVAALIDGAPLSDITERAAAALSSQPREIVESLTQRFLWRLSKQGFVRIPLEEPPAVFFDRYHRVGEVGRGNAGIVHRCRDAEERIVAVKHAWGWLEPFERAERSVAREARALEALAGEPVVPSWLATFHERGLLHVARELVDAEPMARARPADARAAALATARALARLHERGWILLDLSPSNVALRADGSACFIDVGLAHELQQDSVTLPGPAGSPGYAAPEVVREHRADPRSDVWAFGRFLYWLGTGRAPRQAWDAAAFSRAIDEAKLDERLAAIARACAADDPHARPASMADVVTRFAASG